MLRCCWVVALSLLLTLANCAQAGLYYSGEPMAELPSQWRGFLLDQQTLRMIGAKPKPGDAAHPLREQYTQKADELEQVLKKRPLTGDELADLGAIYLRLGEVTRALGVLRSAHEDYPKHFHIAANLGTAWQLQGNLGQSALALKEAVSLAPGKMLQAEEYHLKLVELRLKEPKQNQNLDNLFGVKYVGPDGKYVPGKIAEAEKKKLPARAVAVLQQLCLWLPADGRLLWQLAEIANAHGDVKTAAGMMDGCVVQFGLKHKDLRDHREILKLEADKIAKKGSPGQQDHETHVGGILALSKRPLLSKLNQATLPPISATGLNKLPWVLLSETSMDAKLRPSFPKYLQELNGKTITLNGFMQPFKDDLEVGSFMLIEYPVGCWFCEMPELTGIVLIEMPKGKTATYTRDLVRITGQLILNYTDPEEFLFTVRNVKVSGLD